MICWQMGKTFCKAKIPLSEFKVTTPKNPLINNQAVKSTRNLTTTLAYLEIPTYSLTLTTIPNWTWSCSSLLSFDAHISNLWLTPLHGSQYMTNFSDKCNFYMIFIILLFIKIVSFPLFLLIWFDFYLYLSIHLCFERMRRFQINL